MAIKELVKIAERIYGNDEDANDRNSPLHLVKKHAECAQEYFHAHSELADWGLIEEEVLSVIMMEGFASHIIQDAAFNPANSTELTMALINYMDSALLKTPKCTETILFRNDDFDSNEYHVGQQICFTGFLTTSKEDFDNALSIRWIITPLPPDRTKAHEIYRIYNHGADCNNPEYQIEFERNSTFIVTEVNLGDNFKTIHITETES